MLRGRTVKGALLAGAPLVALAAAPLASAVSRRGLPPVLNVGF